MAKILIIDDRAVNRQFLTTLLGYQHHDLREAADGAEGLRIAREQRPDLIISDVLMPTMDGYEFVRQLREDLAVGQTPVVFSTAHYLSRESQALAEKCGVASIIYKPCEPQTVLDIVSAALQRRVEPEPAAAPEAEEFDHEHQRLLTNKLAETTNQLRDAHGKLTALIELSTELAGERDPVELLDRYCSVAREVIGARWTLVVLLDHDRKTIQHFCMVGLDLDDSPPLRSALLETGVFKTLMNEGQTICLSDVTSIPVTLRLPDSLPRAASLLVAPLAMRGRVDGWICLADKLGFDAFSEQDKQLAEALAAKMAVAYDNARLYSESMKYASKLETEISERKRVEDQLRLQSAALESAANAIMITDANGKIIWVNPAFSRTTGYSFEEAVGRNPRLLNSGKQEPAFYEEMWKTILSGKVWRNTLINRCKGGTLNHEDLTITPILNQTGKITHFVAIKQDITELQQALSEVQEKNEELALMTQQLWQASKLATMGELAASIAHELNNPLATVGLRTENLLMQMPADSDQRKPLEIIAQEVDRMGTLVNNLLQFSRRGHRQVSTVDPREEIMNSIEFVRYHLRNRKIEVVSEFADSLPTIQADRQQLRQLFLNLLTNASDAMPQGGMLTLRADSNGADEAMVAIDFVDTGEGIAAENLERIWDPFFTTKPEGKGTGLGLGICRRIVEEHGGEIDIQSGAGRGTTVHIVLPATTKEVASYTK